MMLIFLAVAALQVHPPLPIESLQDQPSSPIRSSLPRSNLGETARSAAGQAGQRQSREQVEADTGIEPMSRINARIQNRVQSRIRNRIDRYYSPQANATSPFAVASEQVAAARRPRR